MVARDLIHNEILLPNIVRFTFFMPNKKGKNIEKKNTGWLLTFYQMYKLLIILRRRRGCNRMVVGFTTIPMQSVPIVNSNLHQCEVYNIM